MSHFDWPIAKEKNKNFAGFYIEFLRFSPPIYVKREQLWANYMASKCGTIGNILGNTLGISKTINSTPLSPKPRPLGCMLHHLID
jgi:hypothetical protein